MKIFIKNLRGDKTELEVQDSDTILSIKEQLQTLQGHAIDLQKLILAGKILEDAKSAGESNIIEGSTLVLMVSKPKPQAKPAEVPVPPPVMPSPLSSGLSPQSISNPSSNIPPSIPSQPLSNVPEVPESLEGPSALVTGDALTATINNIVDMGFDRKDVEAAMKAAFNNPDRAIEYLTNGLPAAPTNPRAQAPSNVVGDEQQFRQLMQDPTFMQLLAIIQQNPAAAAPILAQLQQSNPEIYNLIMSNRESFMRMLQEPPVPRIDPNLIAGLPRPPPGSTVIQLTPEEQQSIKNLTELGFNRNDAIEAYLSCDKNESLAASLLFENYPSANSGADFDMSSPDRDQDAP